MKPTTNNGRRVIALLCAMLLLLLAGCSRSPAEEKKTELTDEIADVAEDFGTLSGSSHVSVGSPAPLLEPEAKLDDVYGSHYEGAATEAPASAMAEAAGSSRVDGEREPAEAAEPEETREMLSTEPIENAFVLTAAEWNDNKNWPFFTNLVNSGAISFPSYGIDPRNRIEVLVHDADGSALRNETVELLAEDGTVLWTARSDRNGAAYLFYSADAQPVTVQAGDVTASVSVSGTDTSQGASAVRITDTVELTVTGEAAKQSGLQVMFIVDTTGSMSDEIAYLQMDFASIAADTAGEGVTYAACFYRDVGDDYVTKCNSFTSDVAAVQAQLNAEYADGGGDLPEAVAQILTQTLTANEEWREDCVKLAFLIFDAPPHEGTEQALQTAVRAAAEKGIRIIPVVASNADRGTELFGRALAICTGGSYVFLTDDSGVGESHLEPIVGSYQVELLHDIIVRIIEEAKP